MDNNMYNGNTDNNMYNNNMNNYNPIPNPNQYKNCKTRNTVAVLLCILLGILIFIDGIVISLKYGIFSHKSFDNIVENSGLIDEIKDEVLAELDEKNIDLEEESLSESISHILGYVSELIFKGTLPDKDDISEDLKNIYIEISEKQVEGLLKDIKKAGGEVPTEDLIKFDAYRNLVDGLEKAEADEIQKEIESLFGDTVIVNSANEDEVKTRLLDLVDEHSGEITDRLTDEVYDMLLEIKSEITAENGTIFTEIVELISYGITVSIIILTSLILICIVVIALIDKQISVTLRGLFAPCLVPGIILLVISGFFKILAKFISSANNISLAKSAITDSDAELVKFTTGILNTISEPFIIVSVSLIVIAIICKILGTILKPKYDDSF